MKVMPRILTTMMKVANGHDLPYTSARLYEIIGYIVFDEPGPVVVLIFCSD